MAVWFTRWLQCADTILADTMLADTMLAADGIAITIGNDVIAPLLCEKFTLFRAEIVIDAGKVGTPTNDRRDNVLRTRERAHALNHGGAID